jgi:GntR family transcriptional regulator/MocR family aminotransferase
VKINTISLDEEGINIQELKKSNTQVVHTTPSHQFPQGIVTTVNRRLELLKWAHADENRYIIEDDYDSEFRFFGNPIPAMKGLDDSGKVIYMNSFSKTLAPGLRISFMILPEKLIKMYREKLSFYSSSVPTINQLTLEEFINRGEYEKHLNRMKTNYKAKRDYLLNLLNNCSFKDIIKIKGEESGLHFLMDIITNKSEEYLLEKAKDKGIRVYGISEYMIRKCSISETKTIVLGYSNLSKEQLMIGVKLLEEAWKNI